MIVLDMNVVSEAMRPVDGRSPSFRAGCFPSIRSPAPAVRGNGYHRACGRLIVACGGRVSRSDYPRATFCKSITRLVLFQYVKEG